MVNGDQKFIVRFSQKPVYVLAALFALVLWSFLPAIDNDFVEYDDADYLTSNPTVQRGLTLAGVRWAFTSTEVANWHPLTWLSHMTDVQLFGLSPTGHHLTSIILHATSTVLLFAVLQAMTGATGRSFFVAAFFGVHPMRAESVVWAAERKDVLSTVFWMLTLLAYTKYVSSMRSTAPREIAPSQAAGRNKRWYAAALGAFALGLMSKPMLVTLPCVLLLLDIWPLGRIGKIKIATLLLEKLPFFALAAAASLVTLTIQRTAGSVNEGVSIGMRLSNVAISYIRYLGKLFAPTDLAFFYPMPPGWPLSLTIGALLLLAIITAFAVLNRRSRPALLTGWLWYLGTLVPVIGFVVIGQHSIADRYTYIPSIGIFLAMVWTLHENFAGRKALLTTATVIAGIALIGCALLTRSQVRIWRDTETLCRHAIRATTRNHLAHDMLGDWLDKRGRPDEGIQEHLEAVRINPTSSDTRNNFGVGLLKAGRYEEAIRAFQDAIELRPHFPEAFYNLGTACDQVGRTNEAIAYFSRAAALRPNQADTHYNLGNLLLRQEKLAEATAEFNRTLELAPNSADALNNLGIVYERLNQLDQAVRFYSRAIAAKPDDPRIYFNLGLVIQRQGKINEAIVCYREALRLNPDYVQAQISLNALLQLRQPSPAGTNVWQNPR